MAESLALVTANISDIALDRARRVAYADFLQFHQFLKQLGLDFCDYKLGTKTVILLKSYGE